MGPGEWGLRLFLDGFGGFWFGFSRFCFCAEVMLTYSRVRRDAFAGGFVAGIVQGKSLEECVDMGQWLASLSITELGPSYVPILLLFSLKPSEMHYKKQRQPQYSFPCIHTIAIWFSLPFPPPFPSSTSPPLFANSKSGR